MEPERRGIKLFELLVIVFVVSFLAAVVVPTLAASRKSAKKKNCAHNLAQLGTSVMVYTGRVGCGRDYPPATGQNFFNTLRKDARMQSCFCCNDGLFMCDVVGGPPSPTRLDYRNANPGAYGAAKTSDGVTMPYYPIGADKTTNHDINGQDDINVLLFGGSVVTAQPGDIHWRMAITQGYTK